MINRREALRLAAAASAMGISQKVSAKEKQHHNGNTLLGGKIKENGKHKLNKAGKKDVFAEISGGKVVNVSAEGMQVKKVKSRQKFAAGENGLVFVGAEVAQTDVYYYGYWVYDPYGDYYYWFTTDVVIVDNSWVLI